MRNEVTDKAITEILRELKRIRSEPVPDAELNLQKEYVAGNYLLSLESELRNLERVQDINLFGLPKNYYDELIPRLRRLDPNRVQSLGGNTSRRKISRSSSSAPRRRFKAQLNALGPVTVYDNELRPKK